MILFPGVFWTTIKLKLFIKINKRKAKDRIKVKSLIKIYNVTKNNESIKDLPNLGIKIRIINYLYKRKNTHSLLIIIVFI